MAYDRPVVKATKLQQSAAILRAELAAFASRAGYAKAGSIPEEMPFRAWCEDLGERGLKVDGRPFRLDNRPALIPIYDAIPTTRAEAFQRRLIVQKATQLGLTIWEVLADLYMALKWGPITIGAFMPSQHVAMYKSEDRFMRLVRSAPELRRLVTTAVEEDGSITTVGEGSKTTRRIGESRLLFLWTSGDVTTESVPMDVISLDEVQEMTLAQIDKVEARMGDSDVQFSLMLSTANMPDLDINFWYLQGDQRVWHTRCQHCSALSDLSDPAGIFPAKSITFNTGQVRDAPTNDYVWTCPACRGWIEDPQQGEYVIQNPVAGGRTWSFLLPRTISPRITPRAMVEGLGRAKTGDQKKSFYNRVLARPYIDADQLPVTMAHCLACVEEGRRAGVAWEKSGKDYYMGVDQMGGFHCVVIKARMPDGRQRVVHVEANFGEGDANWKRLSELMRLYGIAVCVIEQLPNIDHARAFANRHPGKVFLCTAYPDLADATMRWGDDLSDSERRTAEEDRTRYTVAVHQYKAMQSSLFRVKEKGCLFPDPDLLIQEVVVQDGKDVGARKRIPILRDWVFTHFTKTALVVEDATKDDKVRKKRAKVMKVGIDPHFSFANMLCDIAWARVYGTSTFILPDAPPAEVPEAQSVDQLKASLPGAPAAVLAMIEARRPGTCGGCRHFVDGHCAERGFSTGAAEAACDFYLAAPS